MVENGMSQKHSVVFMHIPKTAGIALDQALREALRPERSLDALTMLGIAYLADSDLEDFDYIHGHFGYRLFHRLKRPSRKITVLRHPVDRVISSYYYYRELQVNFPIVHFSKNNSLEDFIKSDIVEIFRHVNNGQTWQIFYDTGFFIREQHKHLRGRDILRQALENLASFDWVCVQERLDEGVGLLERTLGVSLPGIPRANVTSQRPALANVPEAVIDSIIQRNSLDMELYQAAVAMFEERLAPAAL